MSHNVYFFIDGGALFADIAALKDDDEFYMGKQLSLGKLVAHCVYHDPELHTLCGGSFRRVALYVAVGDARLKRDIQVPPDRARRDFGVEPCGGKLNKDVARAEEWLTKANAPDYVTNLLGRREKGVDTQICCDALTLAATGKLDRLLLYTNDSDFVPLCRALRQLGCNVTLYRLPTPRTVNKTLASACDGYAELSPRREVQGLFHPPIP